MTTTHKQLKRSMNTVLDKQQQVVSMTVAMHKERNEDGEWWIASTTHLFADTLTAQARTVEDCMYEFERVLIGSQTIRGDVFPRHYELAFTVVSIIDVTFDGDKVTGWTNSMESEGE